MPGVTLWEQEWTVDGDVVGVVAALAMGVAPKAVTDANASDKTPIPASVNSPRLTLRNVPPT
jgi:hypothetical protein